VLGVGNIQTLSVTFTPVDSADYTGASAATTIDVLPATSAPPQLAGTWFINGDQTTQVRQNASSLTSANENGNSSPGMFLSSTRVVATGWGNLVGTLSATFGWFRINWANGTAWDMPRLAGDWSINGLATQVAQPGDGGPALQAVNSSSSSRNLSPLRSSHQTAMAFRMRSLASRR
jgi:hypothetical protein